MTATASTDWARRTQATTTVTADANGERWTRDELEFVAEFTDTDTDADIAVSLGRTLYAVWAIQYRIRHEGVDGVIASFDRREQVRPLSSRTYTFVGDDVPPGW